MHFRLEGIKAADPELDLTCLHIVSRADEDAILARPDQGALVRTQLFTELARVVEMYEIKLLVPDAAADSCCLLDA
jgi:hypothetical protein